MKFQTFLILSISCITLGIVKAAKEDCPPGSLDKLKFAELLEKSKIQDCLEETRTAFNESKYQSQTFLFGGDEKLHELNQIVHINDTQLIKDVLDKFGDLIERITFRFASLDHGKEMLEYTSDKCSKTLKSLQLDDCFKNVVDGLKNPFTNVKELKFTNSIIFDTDSDLKARMNVSFPALEVLELEALRIPSVTFVHGSFAKLRTVIIRSLWSSVVDGVDESHFAELFKINAQIETVDVSNCNYLFLKVVTDHLPKLKALKLQKPKIMKYKIDPLHFKAVEEFALFLEEPEEVLEKIIFDSKLEKLDLNVPGDASSSKKWFDFIANQNLTELVFQYKHLERGYFSQIPEKQVQLQKVKISCELEVNAKEIVNFFEKCAELKHLEVTANINEANKEELKKKLGDNWKVGFVDLKSLVIIQVNPKDPDTNTGGANSLVMSHLAQVLTAAFILITIKLY